MRCIRCGKEVPEGTKICEECGFDFTEHEEFRKYFQQLEDPDVPESQKSSLIDNPVLTFIFGIITVILTFLFITNAQFVIIYFVGIIILSYFTLRLSTKPTKVKLIPLRNVGKWFVYFSISIIIFKIIYDLLGQLFF